MDFHPFPNLDLDNILPDTKRMVYPSGLDDADKSHVKYAQPSLKTPTLTIIDTIYNIDGEPVVLPGHYELALSEDNEFLLIMQSKNIIVKIPVFKLERDEEEIQEKYEKSLKKLKWYEFRKKRYKKKRDFRMRESGLDPDAEDFVYTEATIEWIENGEYYLIKYESGSIRAWGAIKQTRF